MAYKVYRRIKVPDSFDYGTVSIMFIAPRINHVEICKSCLIKLLIEEEKNK